MAEQIKINDTLPTIGESCARVAYERWASSRRKKSLPADPWVLLDRPLRDVWEAVAMATVTEYQAQLAAGVVNDRWHEEVGRNGKEAALRELCTKGG